MKRKWLKLKRTWIAFLNYEKPFDVGQANEKVISSIQHFFPFWTSAVDSALGTKGSELLRHWMKYWMVVELIYRIKWTLERTETKTKTKPNKNGRNEWNEWSIVPGVAGRLDKWFGELLDELFDESGPVFLSMWWRWVSVSLLLLLLLLLFLVELVDWWLLMSLLAKLLLFVWMELLFRFDDMAKPFGINALWWWWWCMAKWLWCKLGGSEAIAAQLRWKKETRFHGQFSIQVFISKHWKVKLLPHLLIFIVDIWKHQINVWDETQYLRKHIQLFLNINQFPNCVSAIGKYFQLYSKWQQTIENCHKNSNKHVRKNDDDDDNDDDDGVVAVDQCLQSKAWVKTLTNRWNSVEKYNGNDEFKIKQRRRKTKIHPLKGDDARDVR